ncbi:MAG TPA: hypothetical protein VKA90_02925 [Beijerinckiaceae bacterium]|jgi:hypothetical protein|nr:hypothetical protein [Beijerinckiaceae bacterium]
MSLFLQAVRVATGSDEKGLLVFADAQRLVAVLTHLSDQHEELSGRWFLEAGFGRLDGPDHPTFADLDAAQNRISQRLAGEQARPTPVQTKLLP